jgi:esterase/lipase
MIIRKAVLIIHGFAGGVYDSEPLQYHLTPNFELDVYTFTLPGHDRNLATNISYKDWIRSAEEHVEILIKKGYKSIYVIGHSMGGVLATHISSKYKEIKKLVLVAPAFKYLDDDEKLYDKIDTLVKNGPNIVKTYKAKELLSRILKVSIPMVIEFTKLVELSKNEPLGIKIPTLIIQGMSDIIVPFTSSQFVYDSIKSKRWIIYLKDVNHDVFNSTKKDIINNEIEKFLTYLTYNRENVRHW